ncbi:AtpZ/AtpI family protein [Inediibacterium massiliense]|uniref:AtpZ/AtpI family protein n=1 Tax=Inediibacterium massiliense TaxID=1658111 RepID=UPI0006B68AFA|nr:AtpZ/AtpI family protein [Inediibacterium massiliense]
MKNITLITQIGISMVIPILAGVYAGNWLDAKFKTNFIFLLICIILGIGTSFLHVYKMVMRDFKNK